MRGVGVHGESMPSLPPCERAKRSVRGDMGLRVFHPLASAVPTVEQHRYSDWRKKPRRWPRVKHSPGASWDGGQSSGFSPASILPRLHGVSPTESRLTTLAFFHPGGPPHTTPQSL